MIKKPCKAFIQAFLCLALLSLSKSLTGPSTPLLDPLQAKELQCLVSVVYHEARGESVKGRRAVLDVVQNRVFKSGKSFCQIVVEKRQFAWVKKKPMVSLTDDTLSSYSEATEFKRVLGPEYLWFYSGKKPVWARKMHCRKIDNHFFCKGKHA